jgi:hypothetical protein
MYTCTVCTLAVPQTAHHQVSYSCASVNLYTQHLRRRHNSSMVVKDSILFPFVESLVIAGKLILILNLVLLSHFTYSRCYKSPPLLFFRVPHSLPCKDYFYLRSDTFEEVLRCLRRFPTQCLASLCLATCIMAEPDSLRSRIATSVSSVLSTMRTYSPRSTSVLPRR